MREKEGRIDIENEREKERNRESHVQDRESHFQERERERERGEWQVFPTPCVDWLPMGPYGAPMEPLWTP